MSFIVSQPLYQQVYERVRESILSGELKPGSKVVVTRLAEEYQISRTPLREALRQLQKEGLLVQDNQETRVVSIDVKDFEELCMCRLVLEKQIMSMIVDEITDEKIEEAEELVKQAGEAGKSGDYLKFLELNSKFHDVLVYTCSNKRLIQLLEQVRSLLLIYRVSVLRANQYNHEITTDHLELLEAIKDRDTERAVETIAEHVKSDLKRGKIFNETGL
ncbi:GntR family transcriptional regulator [bacterium LRH843]|nr:GntR family transcriptional regulator [bacterium LRH843]